MTIVLQFVIANSRIVHSLSPHRCHQPRTLAATVRKIGPKTASFRADGMGLLSD